jgi:streptogramin lyase
VPLQGGGLPQAVAADGAHVWVVDVSSQTVTQLDSDGSNVRVIGTPAGPTDLAAVHGDAWVTYGFTSDPGRRVDVVSSEGGISPADVAVPDGTTPISSADGVVWLTSARSAVVVRDDTLTGTTTTVRLPASSGPVDVAAAADLSTAWVASGRRNEVYRVIVGAGPTRVSSFSTGGSTPSSIAVAADGAVWVVAHDDDALVSLTADGDTRLRLALGSQCDAPSDVAATPHTIWVACSGNQRLVGLDPRTGAITSSVALDGIPVALAADEDGRVWVLSAART